VRPTLRIPHAISLAALLLAAAGTPARATPGPGEPQTWAVDSSTTGVLVEDHRAPLVELRLVLSVGTWSAWPLRSYSIAAAWDLQFRDARGVLRARADRLAADISFSSDAHSFTFAVGCRREDLDSALVLVRDILANRDFDAREIARRSRTSMIDWKAGQRNPDFMLDLTARRLLWRENDPRAWPLKPWRIGNDAARLTAARDSLLRFPGRFIGFAGDLTRVEAERRAAGLLPPAVSCPPALLASGLKPVRRAEPRPRDEVVPLPRLTQVYFKDVRHALPLDDPDWPALLVANHVLGGNFYSRLSTALRHEGGYTYDASSGFGVEPDTTMYEIDTCTRTASADTVERKIREVLATFRERGITEEERAAAVGYLLGRRAFQRQSPAQVLDWFLWERARGLAPGARDAAVDRAAALPLDGINAFIRRFYDPAAFTMIRAQAK
jgi:zinc protease